MSSRLRTLKGLLEGDIDNVSRSDVSQQIFFTSTCLFSFFLLDHVLDVVLEGAGFVERWDEFGEDYFRIIPFGLSGFPGFMVEFLPGNPFLVVGGFIEGRPFRSVPDHVAVAEGGG